MTAKDSKIINDNPNKTLYELINLGLSGKGAEEYEKLILNKPKPVNQTNQLVASKTEPTKAHVALPHLSHTLPTQQNKGMAKVLNVKTGRIKDMTILAAESLVRQTPNDYRIVG